MAVDIQIASLWKRIAAWMLDLILVSVLATGFGWGLSAAMNYDASYDVIEEGYARYEKEYGVTFDITEEEYYAMSDAERANFDKANQMLVADEELNKAYSMLLSQTMVIVTLGVLFAILATHVFLPLYFGNGQTIGKKVFALGVTRVDCVKITTLQLFVRSVLGVFTIETMFPLYMVLLSFFGVLGFTGVMILAVLLLIQVIMLLASRNRSQLHDLLAGTMVIDIASQKIFETQEALLEYTKRIHAEAAARKDY
jgi:uncharacterized RDD family membrane protein YckC